MRLQCRKFIEREYGMAYISRNLPNEVKNGGKGKRLKKGKTDRFFMTLVNRSAFHLFTSIAYSSKLLCYQFIRGFGVSW
jgi:hypothetical protein